MKKFTISYKLQTVPRAEKPIQIILNLNTKLDGKYLQVAKSISINCLEKEWNRVKSLPNDLKLGARLLTLQDYILEGLEDQQNESDEVITTLYKSGWFAQHLTNAVTRIIHKDFTDYHKAFEIARDYTVTDSKTEREKIKNEMINKGFRIIDAEGHLIDLDRFFSNLSYFPDEYKLSKVAAVKPSSQQSSIQSEDLYPIPFHEYIDYVADQKMKMEVLNKRGVMDYKQKLGARFKMWDEDITLGQMTDNTSAEFFQWLRDNYDFSANYYANFKKWVKSVLNFATVEEKKQLPNINTESKTYEQNKEEVFFPYLTEEMLSVLLKMEFTDKSKHLEYTRDLFYIASYTGGLTFGDLSQAFNIQSRLVDGHTVKYIRIARNKTGTPAEIPLMDDVHEILKKYDFTFKKITNQHYNNNIQEICRIAGFTDDFHQMRRSIKTKKQETVSTPFYQLIGSHTARRNFCTNFYYHRNMAAHLIMEFSQHSKLESFLSYVQASAKVKFDEFSKKVVISKREEVVKE